MKFQKIFIEYGVDDSPVVERVKQKYSDTPIIYLDNIDEVFGVVKKPYLQKRTNLNCFIGSKRGTIVKKAPSAYGLFSDAPHYYFIHAYNCIYECQYCYLQGYFNTPDIVLYVNYEQIVEEMQKTVSSYKHSTSIWFHAGEFSDSLALSSLTEEWSYYIGFLNKFSHVNLELRTKSILIDSLLKFKNPPQNFIVTYSLTTEHNRVLYEKGVPKISSRLKAIKTLVDNGFQIGVHFDPIIDYPNVLEEYKKLFNDLRLIISNDQLKYISLGVVRYTKSVYRAVKKNYPLSPLHAHNYVAGFDQKMRYVSFHRNYLLQECHKYLKQLDFDEKYIYFCME